jgi:aerobic carbon-monoxide dehydrogenase medium subunit
VGDGLTDPWGDILAPADYRRRIAPVVARRAFDRIGEVGR